MGSISDHQPVMLVMSLITRHIRAIEWAMKQIAAKWGPVESQSDPFHFHETKYYEKAMGPGLSLTLVVFNRFIHPFDLVEIKCTTNKLEEELADQHEFEEQRPLNLDPGYLTPAKFVLATTKDASHRLYLGNGIYGEITLSYTHGAWRDQEWTYPNYRREDYKAFLMECRKFVL
jgi:hypothetical protein